MLIHPDELMNALRFNSKKTKQALIALLRVAPRQQMTVLRVMKLLYIADRECLRKAGRTITGDSHFALPHGPIVSSTLSILKGESPEDWTDHIRTSYPTVMLTGEPVELTELSRLELEILMDVHRTYQHLDEWELVELTHEFPEWAANAPVAGGPKARRIGIEQIFNAVGRGPSASALIEAMRDQQQAEAAFDSVFSSAVD